ncbi:hypothetical protein [Mycobacterium riyadhense]|uniref:Uncharacterized protein n=1 Tax=Mycobacterium riyadhense TaxID=486698 RepID=A0A1X2C0B3_9MYCO|nr:hypothetical protein [Mycobacterium riyadhense]MCV7145972.1 hypothetical protein [Mycobacterium riyadhense]ORW69264.1 hypothetical protein AWC22_25895 [Mycobacterium riyadhense]VTO97915.1 hypothetical protein BIN_B_02300 [Mycobacterium riyadhense]
MTLQWFARAALAVLIGVAALVGGSGVARADPSDDAFPEIIDDLLIIIPGLTQDPRALNPGVKGGPQRDWGGIGMYCQNRNVTCKKMGF